MEITKKDEDLIFLFDLDGTYKSTDHQPTPSKSSCMYCPFKSRKDLCSSAI